MKTNSTSDGCCSKGHLMNLFIAVLFFSFVLVNPEPAFSQVTSCTGVADFTLCTDGDACTAPDRCISQTCVPGRALICNDQNLCTTDGCNHSTGCVFTPVSCN